MNVLDITLERFRKARVWIDDSPIDANYSPSPMVCKVGASQSEVVEARRVVLEVAIPMGYTMYGLLGGKIEPIEGGFEFVVQPSNQDGNVFSEALVSAESDDIRCGLADEFVPTVARSIEDCLMRRKDQLPNARLTIDVAACGAVGSNQVVFKKLAMVLFDALIGKSVPTQDSLRQSMNATF